MNSKNLLGLFVIIGAIYYFFLAPEAFVVNEMGGITVEERNYHINYVPDGNQEAAIYMVFGAGETRSNGKIFGEVFLSGLPVNDAEYIKSQYPDFIKCNSKGSKFVKNKLVDFSIFPSSGNIRKKIEQVGADNNERNLNNGYRLCVSITGKTLSPKFESTNPNINFNVDAMNRRNHHYMLLENVDVFDCHEVM